jgi:hypothetical protein
MGSSLPDSRSMALGRSSGPDSPAHQRGGVYQIGDA